jgi:hypothetical protein
MMPNIAAIIRHHVSLEVRCIDRLYLHAMPKLQTSGALYYFVRDRPNQPCAATTAHDDRMAGSRRNASFYSRQIEGEFCPQPHPSFIEVSGEATVCDRDRTLAGAGKDGPKDVNELSSPW